MARYGELDRLFTDKLTAGLGTENLGEKSSVLKRCLNVLSDGADMTVVGRLFHARAVATVKALAPTVERERERERDGSAERRRCRWLQSVDVAVSQGLMTLFEARSQGRVATDRGSSGRQVEQACTRPAAPSSASEVAGVASHGRTSATHGCIYNLAFRPS